MNKLIITLIFFTVSLLAREEAFATKECPAFNNMKHSKNTHAVHLDTKQKYTILKHHKGQVLVLIKGEQPAQRWVDEKCFVESQNGSNPMNVEKVESKVISIEDALRKTSEKYEKKKKIVDSRSGSGMTAISKQNLLTLTWHNAFCETHRYKKECKRTFFPKYEESHFVLLVVGPQPKNKIYCNVDIKHVAMDKHHQWSRLPDLGLSDETKKRLAKVMPGYISNLHKHEWIKHGTCYGKDADSYYSDSVSLVEQVNDSQIGKFFKQNIGKVVTLREVRALFDRSFGVDSGKRVGIRCKGGLITELWLHLGSGSDDLATLLRNGKETRSRCQKGHLDKAGF